MIVTTTPNIEGKSIREYRGIVVGEAIMGANVVRIQAHGIGELRAIGQQAQAPRSYDERLAAVGVELFDEVIHILLGHGVIAEPDFIVDVDIDDELGGGSGGECEKEGKGNAVEGTNHCVSISGGYHTA